MIDRLRRPAMRLVRAVDHAVGRLTGRARLLVDVRTPMNLAVLRPVWHRLAADPRIRIDFAAEDADGVRAALARDGMADHFMSRDSAEWTRFDVAMNADVWNPVPLRRCRRRINFFHGVAGKYDLDKPQRLAAAGIHTYDRVAFINRDRMARYLAAGVLRPEQAVLVGFPKADDLVNGVWAPADVRASLGLPTDVPTVLYAPTFSTANSLHLAGEAIIGGLLDSDRNVIVKLHDRTLNPSAATAEPVDWKQRLARFNTHPRYVFVESGNIGPFLSAADVLVTDHSTVGFEFALLDRPIVVYDAPALKDAARIEEGKWMLLRSMADVVDSPGALVTAIEAALADPGRLRHARRQARELFANVGEATRHAVAAVYALMNLEPPAELGEHPAVRRGHAVSPAAADAPATGVQM